MNECKPNLPSLTQLTKQLRAANISLKWDISLSGLVLVSNKNIPAELRGTIWRYSRELLIMLILGDIRVCVNPDRHRRYWYYMGGKFRLFCCQKCFDRGLDNTRPLHQARDIIQVMSREQDEELAV